MEQICKKKDLKQLNFENLVIKFPLQNLNQSKDLFENNQKRRMIIEPWISIHKELII